ncbi:MAG: DUF3795 domain-containing protein [Bacillota bacterium]
MLAYCGIDCKVCPVFMASQADDAEQKAQVAALWSKQFNMNLTPDDIACDGCRTAGGKLFAHCRTCFVRNCGMKKNVNTCRDCETYACDELNLVFRSVPAAKKNLEGS